MLDMLNDRWRELLLYFISISVIFPNYEGHRHHTEEITGNCKHMLKLLPIVQPVNSHTMKVVSHADISGPVLLFVLPF
jgi:hypothetical protein